MMDSDCSDRMSDLVKWYYENQEPEVVECMGWELALGVQPAEAWLWKLETEAKRKWYALEDYDG